MKAVDIACIEADIISSLLPVCAESSEDMDDATDSDADGVCLSAVVEGRGAWLPSKAPLRDCMYEERKDACMGVVPPTGVSAANKAMS